MIFHTRCSPALRTAVACVPSIRDCATLEQVADALFNVQRRDVGNWAA